MPVRRWKFYDDAFQIEHENGSNWNQLFSLDSLRRIWSLRSVRIFKFAFELPCSSELITMAVSSFQTILYKWSKTKNSTIWNWKLAYNVLTKNLPAKSLRDFWQVETDFTPSDYLKISQREALNKNLFNFFRKANTKEAKNRLILFFSSFSFNR